MSNEPFLPVKQELIIWQRFYSLTLLNHVNNRNDKSSKFKFETKKRSVFTRYNTSTSPANLNTHFRRVFLIRC